MTQVIIISNYHLHPSLASSHEEAFRRLREVCSVFGMDVQAREAVSEDPELSGWGPYKLFGWDRGDMEVSDFGKFPEWAQSEIAIFGLDERGEKIPLPDDFKHGPMTTFMDLAACPRRQGAFSNVARAYSTGWEWVESDPYDERIAGTWVPVFAHGLMARGVAVVLGIADCENIAGQLEDPMFERYEADPPPRGSYLSRNHLNLPRAFR